MATDETSAPGQIDDDAGNAAALPTFCLTFDTELVWGSLDLLSPAAFARQFPDVRGTIAGVIRLLERYEVPATWAIVGHLFLARCDRDAAGMAHPEILSRPRQRGRHDDWYAVDPCTGRERDPLFYGDDIVDSLLAVRAPQEIGCHSFSHALYGDPEMTAAAVDADLSACREAAAARGIELRSFVFPRNLEGHHDRLAAHGFVAYRGADPNWYRGLPRPARRIAALADQAVGATPPVGQPSERLPGLWNIPGSALIPHRLGLRRLVSARSRRRKARAGIDAAIARGAVFHLWTHPFNLACDPPFMLGYLEAVLQEAVDARDRGALAIETMGEIAARLGGAPPVSATPASDR